VFGIDPQSPDRRWWRNSSDPSTSCRAANAGLICAAIIAPILKEQFNSCDAAKAMARGRRFAYTPTPGAHRRLAQIVTACPARAREWQDASPGCFCLCRQCPQGHEDAACQRSLSGHVACPSALDRRPIRSYP
jgi:hypothetical protein